LLAVEQPIVHSEPLVEKMFSQSYQPIADNREHVVEVSLVLVIKKLAIKFLEFRALSNARRMKPGI
jgi:hypothetical protein